MLKLAAFADEISPDLDEQVRVCRANDVTHVELRGVNGLNVLAFPKPLREEIRVKLRDNGMGVVGIGSPVGKSRIDEPWDRESDRFKVAVELAEFFGAPFVRIFSYYAPDPSRDIRAYRDEVVRRMRAKVDYLATVPGVTIVHENEKDIYGERGRQCLDLMRSVDSPRLRCAFDFANFVQAGERPRDNWPLLKPYTAHIHIKDATFGAGGPGGGGGAGIGKVVPAGEGDGDIAAILPDAYAGGYRGFLSLEPHLKVAGHSHGETGPELFKVAADALKNLCRAHGIPLASAGAR
jgi:3-dehydroshikimate dehydratase